MTVPETRDDWLTRAVADIDVELRTLWIQKLAVSEGGPERRQIQERIDELAANKLRLTKDPERLRREHSARHGGIGLAFLAVAAVAVLCMVFGWLPLVVTLPVAISAGGIGLFWLGRE